MKKKKKTTTWKKNRLTLEGSQHSEEGMALSKDRPPSAHCVYTNRDRKAAVLMA